MIKNLTFVVIMAATFGCTQTKKAENGVADTSNISMETGDIATTSKPISTDSMGLITTVSKPAMLLFGQIIEVEYAQIYATLQMVTPAIISQISNAGAIMTGSVIFLYQEIPKNGESIKLFVGVPVKNKFKIEGETTFIEIHKADYYRMDCNAEAGKTFEHHLRMQKLLQHKNLKYSAPVLELISESRNNEMTMVSKASLLYSKD